MGEEGSGQDEGRQEMVLRRTCSGDSKGRPQIAEFGGEAAERLVSEERKARFLEELGVTCNIRLSARRAGLCERTVYKLRHRDPEFERGWMRALDDGYATLEMELLRRACFGVKRVEQTVKQEDRTVKTVQSADVASGMRLLHRHADGVARLREERKAQAAVEPPDVRIARLRAKLQALEPEPKGGAEGGAPR